MNTEGWLIYGSRGRVLVRAQGGRLVWTLGITETGWLKSDFIFCDAEVERAIETLNDTIESPVRKQPVVLSGGKLQLVGKEESLRG